MYNILVVKQQLCSYLLLIMCCEFMARALIKTCLGFELHQRRCRRTQLGHPASLPARGVGSISGTQITVNSASPRVELSHLGGCNLAAETGEEM